MASPLSRDQSRTLTHERPIGTPITDFNRSGETVLTVLRPVLPVSLNLDQHQKSRDRRATLAERFLPCFAVPLQNAFSQRSGEPYRPFSFDQYASQVSPVRRGALRLWLLGTVVQGSDLYLPVW